MRSLGRRRISRATPGAHGARRSLPPAPASDRLTSERKDIAFEPVQDIFGQILGEQEQVVIDAAQRPADGDWSFGMHQAASLLCLAVGRARHS